jgi:hypothetical protein
LELADSRGYNLLGLRAEVGRQCAFEEAGRARIPVLRGGVLVPRFLSTEGRQYLEGQVFTRGEDLGDALGATPSPDDALELVVAQPELAIPALSGLRRTLDRLLWQLLNVYPTQHSLQLRIFYPGTRGHPTHVDYAKECDRSSDVAPTLTTSVSCSVPISWNGGVAPQFLVHCDEGTLMQDTPGSLVIFGPNVPHTTPAPALAAPYIWLVTQAFFTSNAGTRDESLHSLMPTLVQAFGEQRVTLASHGIQIALPGEPGEDRAMVDLCLSLLSEVVPSVDRDAFVVSLDDPIEIPMRSGFRLLSPSLITIRRSVSSGVLSS